MNKKIFTVLLCFWPMLNVYSYQAGGLLGIGDICVLLYACMNIRYCRRIRFFREVEYYFVFLIAIIALSLIDTCLIGEKGDGLGAITSVARIAFYSVIIVVFVPRLFEVEYGIRIIKGITVISSLVVYLQTLLYMFLGRVTLLILPVLPLANGETYSKMYNTLVAHSGRYYFRASAFFSEPAHFAQYALIGILLFLYTRNGEQNVSDRKSFWLAVLCSGATVLSTSSIGIILTVVIWVYWTVSVLLRKYVSVNLMKNYAIVVPLCAVAFLYLIQRLNVFTILLGKLKYTTIMDSNSSFAYRVTRGFEIFSKFPFWEKLFGIGFGNLKTYLQSSDTLNEYARSDYMNSMAYILCSVGVVGFLLFLLLFYKVVGKNRFLRIFTFYILVLSCCASIFSSDIWMVLMAVYIMYDRANITQTDGSVSYG